MKDTLVALGVVAGVLFAVWLYAGTWPPMVVVESGSMMHCDPTAQQGACSYPRSYGTAEVPPGRIGTIDPGDLVVVKEVDARTDVELWVDGYDRNGNLKADAELHYGEPGDVIIYRPYGDATRTPIIHRAITWVEVKDLANGKKEFEVKWWDGVRKFGDEGIDITTDKGIEVKFRPEQSGFITKGDNPESNRDIDQQTTISRNRPVAFSEVEGVARGELPWFGLIKLAISGKVNERKCEESPSACPGWWKVLYAWAPRDLWVGLVLSLGVLIGLPFVVDFVQDRIGDRRRERDGLPPPPPPGNE